MATNGWYAPCIPNFFLLTIFPEVQPPEYNKICMRFNPRGVHSNPCQLPDYSCSKRRFRR